MCTISQVSDSPFHGIFAFGNTSAAKSSTQLSTPADTQTPLEDSPTNDAASFGASQSGTSSAQQGQIAVDIYEQDNYYIIRAPVAGVKLSDIDIEVDGKVITIRGARKVAEDVPEQKFFLQECYWGEFSRSITMPCTVDPKKIKATFSKDSVLKILIPKEEKVKIIRINESS